MNIYYFLSMRGRKKQMLRRAPCKDIVVGAAPSPKPIGCYQKKNLPISVAVTIVLYCGNQSSRRDFEYHFSEIRKRVEIRGVRLLSGNLGLVPHSFYHQQRHLAPLYVMRAYPSKRDEGSSSRDSKKRI